MFRIDVHFYVSLVGTECDKGRGTRENLVKELKKCTSLSEKEANEFLDAMIAHEKLVLRDGKYVCTIPA